MRLWNRRTVARALRAVRALLFRPATRILQRLSRWAGTLAWAFVILIALTKEVQAFLVGHPDVADLSLFEWLTMIATVVISTHHARSLPRLLCEGYKRVRFGERVLRRWMRRRWRRWVGDKLRGR
jgi:hypothetical protein